MNFFRIPLLAWLMCCSMAAQAAPFDYVEMEVRAPAPAIEVDGGVQGWNTASSNTLSYHAAAKGKCSWGFRNTFVSLTLDSNEGNHGGVLSANQLLDSPKNKAMTWSEDWKDVALSWKPSAAVRKQAVAACEAVMEQRVAAGELRAAVLAAGHVTSLMPASLGLHFSCDDYGMTGYKKDLFREAPVTVKCKPVDLPAPKPTVPGAEKFKPAFQLTHVNVTADPENYKGICPKEITFTGHINTNGAGGELNYRFLRDGQPVSAFKPLKLLPGQKVGLVNYAMTAQEDVLGKGPLPKLVNQAQVPLVQPLSVKQVPRVVLEVKTDEQSLTADAAYAFTCQVGPSLQSKPTELPDITAQHGIQIGLQSAMWGGAVALSASDASVRSAHGCSFRLAYDVINQGGGPAAAFSSLLLDGQSALHTQAVPKLAATQSHKVNGMITLLPGSYLLRASLDDSGNVPESNEGNNVFRVSVNVADECANRAPGREGNLGTPAKPGIPARTAMPARPMR